MSDKCSLARDREGWTKEEKTYHLRSVAFTSTLSVGVHARMNPVPRAVAASRGTSRKLSRDLVVGLSLPNRRVVDGNDGEGVWPELGDVGLVGDREGTR
jgi:hypothetical protein